MGYELAGGRERRDADLKSHDVEARGDANADVVVVVGDLENARASRSSAERSQQIV